MPHVIVEDGEKIAYTTFGRGDGTPVLMIQGLGVDGRGWALQRGQFGRSHRCIVPDNRGTGASSKPPGPYDLVQMAQDAIQVLDAVDIERAHSVGASMGGVIAQIDAILAMSDDMRFELPRLHVPTLVITGSQDTLTPLGDAEELAEFIPGAHLHVLAGAAHGLMAEAPGAFNRAVLSFIEQVDAVETDATIVELPSLDLTAAEASEVRTRNATK